MARQSNHSSVPFGLGDEVYKALCEDISNGVFKPGDRMGIEKIASMKGVSHMPVREAFLRMERDGLLVKLMNCGYRVKKISMREGQEIWALRIALETMAVSWLMRHRKISSKMLAELRRNCEQYRQCKFIRELFLLDLKFHKIIIDHCGAKLLQDILSRRMILLNSFYLYNSMKEIPSLDSIERSYHEHMHIIDCIESGNAAEAEKTMHDHLEQAKNSLQKFFGIE